MHKAEPLRQAKTALGFLYTGKDMRRAKACFAAAVEEESSFLKSHLYAILAANQTASDNQYAALCQGDIGEDLFTYIGKVYFLRKKYGSVENMKRKMQKIKELDSKISKRSV